MAKTHLDLDGRVAAREAAATHSRRAFLAHAAIAGAAIAGFDRHPDAFQGGPGPFDPWRTADEIRRRIRPPVFPSREFDIRKFGAKDDGRTECTDAMREAISACAAAGGGRVVVPPGRFVTGAVRLKSRVDLHLAEGATLAFSRDPTAYLPLVLTRFEGVELMNYSPFIYALDERDVAITGSGTLDGQANEEFWWSWPRRGPTGVSRQAPARNRLLEMSEKRVPPAERRFGPDAWLRPNFIQPYRCSNVLIEGVKIVNSPMWEVHPVLCTNVTIRGLNISSHGPNNDGCDPESCRDVLIENCAFDTGDDCIALKSGRNEDGRRIGTPIENVIVRECDMKDGHGGVTIGSEISGGARNIFAERCRMDSPRLERALRFKNNAARGGVIERVAMRDVTIGELAEAVVAADFYYEEGRKGAFTPVLRDVDVRNVTSRKSQYAFLLRGFDTAPITNIRVTDCTFDGVAKPDVLESVRGLVLRNVRINGTVRTETVDR